MRPVIVLAGNHREALYRFPARIRSGEYVYASDVSKLRALKRGGRFVATGRFWLNRNYHAMRNLLLAKGFTEMES